eukprot:TRINITY_DN35044_c0_g1_i1.p1 TRINITY_DN35044_c0_g1~~TRINITY_DN35044_c0_g1_i1.p1  ORF type:complete len:173 (+),score=31.94 TRINITY_DN35044_c0_g1_i1:64-582(+)
MSATVQATAQRTQKAKEEVFEPWVMNIAARVKYLVKKNTGVKVLPADHLFGAFVSAAVPGITIESYIMASYKAAIYCKLQNPVQCWEAALILLERLPENVVTEFTVHRLLRTAYLIGMKICSDRIISNKVVSLYGGISMKEMNSLERHFLAAVDFRVNITSAQYKNLWVYVI